jgi:uncharacterized protein (DUF302 family)
MPVSDPSVRPEGLTDIPSVFGPKETMDRLEAEIRKKGMNLFVRIDHGAGAAEVGLTLRPTELIIFGNARGGTPLMQSAQTVGIDLPLKALVCRTPPPKHGFYMTNLNGSRSDMV